MEVGCLEYPGDGTTRQLSHELQLKKKQATIPLSEKTTGEGKWWFGGGEGRGGENMAKNNSQQTPLEETPDTV